MNDCDRVDHDCGVPYEILKGIMDRSGRKTAHTSATMLTNSCLRRVWLEQHEDYYINPMVMFPAWRGTMGHQMTEAYPEPGCIYETRFESIIKIGKKRVKITGALDKLDITKKHIEDFKTKGDSKLKSLKSPEYAHTLQLNIYRWLVFNGWPQKKFEHNGTIYKVGIPAKIQVNSLKLDYWSMGQIKMYEPPLMDLQDVEEYILERAEKLITSTPEIPEDLDPFKSALCLNWCSVRDHCIRYEIGF
jgi:hypothetical protein